MTKEPVDGIAAAVKELKPEAAAVQLAFSSLLIIQSGEPPTLRMGLPYSWHSLWKHLAERLSGMSSS